MATFEDEASPEDVSLWANKALQQMLQANSKPPLPLFTKPVDARAEILAACELNHLPALQSLAQGFTKALGNPDVSVTEVVASIERDPALCVRVLRMANSTAVSSSQRVDKLETAIQLLGVERVRQLAEAILILRTASPKPGELDMRQLWIHALATASVAAQLEKWLRTRDSAPVYLAGLLHDVGKIVLSMISPEQYRSLLVRAWNEKKPLAELELGQLGIEHCEAGVAFARQNKLGPVVTEAIAHHADPRLAQEFRFEVAVVSVANYVSKAFSLGFSGYPPTGNGVFENLPAWLVLEQELGYPVDVAALGEELKAYVMVLRPELAVLKE